MPAVELSKRFAGPYLETVFTYVDTGHYYHHVLLIRIIPLSASPLANAGPRPLNLFGVSDWREGCLTPARHDRGNSPVRPKTVDAPLPPVPQIGLFAGQLQHTNDGGG